MSLALILYINDLPKVTKNKWFADDLPIVATYNKNNVEKYENDVNISLEYVMKWFNRNSVRDNLIKKIYGYIVCFRVLHNLI